MNSHLAPKIPGLCVANLRNSLLLRAIRRLFVHGWPYAAGAWMYRSGESGHFEHNLLRPELIRGSLNLSYETVRIKGAV